MLAQEVLIELPRKTVSTFVQVCSFFALENEKEMGIS